MTNKKNSNEVINKITMEVLEHLDLRQFEPIEQKKKMSGEDNPYWNKDAVYLIGGVLNQLAWSLTSKTKYLDELDKNFVERQVIENSSEDVKPNNIIKAEASLHNGLFLYDMMVSMFNIYTGWTWNDGKHTKDFGQKWFADYKESQSNKVSTTVTSDIMKQMKERLSK